jgi:rubrerythrin
MPELKGSKTHENLKRAFASETQANRRYVYYARIADVEGQPDIAGLFRDTAEGESGHAMGILEILKKAGDPITDLPMSTTRENLRSARIVETEEFQNMYPSMAQTAREEGFEDVAEWFETLARAERSHARRFEKAIETLED